MQAIGTSNELWSLLQILDSSKVLANAYLAFDAIQNLSVLFCLKAAMHVSKQYFEMYMLVLPMRE